MSVMVTIPENAVKSLLEKTTGIAMAFQKHALRRERLTEQSIEQIYSQNTALYEQLSRSFYEQCPEGTLAVIIRVVNGRMMALAASDKDYHRMEDDENVAAVVWRQMLRPDMLPICAIVDDIEATEVLLTMRRQWRTLHSAISSWIDQVGGMVENFHQGLQAAYCVKEHAESIQIMATEMATILHLKELFAKHPLDDISYSEYEAFEHMADLLAMYKEHPDKVEFVTADTLFENKD